jgi:hypothetical protein
LSPLIRSLCSIAFEKSALLQTGVFEKKHSTLFAVAVLKTLFKAGRLAARFLSKDRVKEVSKTLKCFNQN